MSAPSRIPRYDVRNDGTGPFAIFYCDECYREFRSTPSLGGAIASSLTQDLGQQVKSSLLRKVPLVGRDLANNLNRDDPRYSMDLSGAKLEAAWNQVKDRFRECPTCGRILCLSDFDERTGFCKEDSPRTSEIAEAEGEQVGAALKGFASAFGLGGVLKQVSDVSKAAFSEMARCPADGTLANPGTKFCPECGAPMIQPTAETCTQCGVSTKGAKFCPECGAKVQAPTPALPPGTCPSCGVVTPGAKFCSECGTKL
jgi:membrane protease subunit (stomatin/prohibitin family)